MSYAIDFAVSRALSSSLSCLFLVEYVTYSFSDWFCPLYLVTELNSTAPASLSVYKYLLIFSTPNKLFGNENKANDQTE